jgi:hypothetical protein
MTFELATPTASCGSCQGRIAAAFESVGGVEVRDPGSRDEAHHRRPYDPATKHWVTIVETMADAGYPPPRVVRATRGTGRTAS